MKILITICARGGSKGIPRKNIIPINGKPLIAYSIEIAKKFSCNFDCDIALSTDDSEIKHCAETFGLTTGYLRPEYLATDKAGKIDVIFDVLKYQEIKNQCFYDYVIDLDITSPLRTLDDLLEAFEILQADHNALNIFSVNPAHRNPYFNMVEQLENGYFGTVKKLSSTVFTRQEAPKIYDLNASFYIYNKEFFNQNCRSAITDKSLIFIMPHICFDLDEISDFDYLSYLLENKKLTFEI